MNDDIILETRDGLGVIRLNRPKALNTLSLSMYRRFDPQLVAWGKDPAIRAVVVQGEGGRAFCAGGDVRAIYDARQGKIGSGDYKTDFFREEYSLISRIHRFPKPYVALLDGIVMGGGAGISVNGAYRVATEKTLFAMPEVQIGLFPDVGASRFLNLCPGKIGLYLALTSKRIGTGDAIYSRFATHFISSEKLPAVVAALAGIEWRAGDERKQVEAALTAHVAVPPVATLSGLQPEIDRVFAGGSVEAILAALDRESADWAREAREAMRRASPLALKLAFRQLAQGQGMSVEEALTLEYRLTQHVMAAHDFFEGIRALLVDKDNKPRWQHASLAAVSAADVDSYFADLGPRELRFG